MFRKYRYTGIRVGLDLEIKIEKGYKDTSYRVTIADYKFIVRFLPKARIRIIITLLQVTTSNYGNPDFCAFCTEIT